MQKNKIDCPCKRKNCERYQDCAACKEYHRSSPRKLPPACEHRKDKGAGKAKE